MLIHNNHMHLDIFFLLLTTTYIQQYILTPEGIAMRTKLTLDFMKRKMKEYDELKMELKKK